MSTEQTLILVKPDGVKRGLTGEILRRIEAKGYTLVDLRLV
ncbi:MAG: nucleoside-diphosphate kinase, partial [Actinobacteria bacterium]|nr:nucleoside-diphosphate kinase [Actinomycetota bacterium]